MSTYSHPQHSKLAKTQNGPLFRRSYQSLDRKRNTRSSSPSSIMSPVKDVDTQKNITLMTAGDGFGGEDRIGKDEVNLLSEQKNPRKSSGISIRSRNNDRSGLADTSVNSFYSHQNTDISRNQRTYGANHTIKKEEKRLKRAQITNSDSDLSDVDDNDSTDPHHIRYKDFIKKGQGDDAFAEKQRSTAIRSVIDMPSVNNSTGKKKVDTISSIMRKKQHLSKANAELELIDDFDRKQKAKRERFSSGDSFGNMLKNSTIREPIDIPAPNVKNETKSPPNIHVALSGDQSLVSAESSEKSRRRSQRTIDPPHGSSEKIKSVNLKDVLTGNKRAKSSQENDIPKLRRLDKSLLDNEDKIIMNSSKSAASKLTKLTKKLNADNNEDFLAKLKSTEVWNPELASGPSNLEDELNFDINEEITIGLNNSLEVLDEEQNNVKQRRIVKDKYKGKSYNGSIKSDELKRRVEEHWNCIPSILKGQSGSPYLDYATKLSKESRTSMMSRGDFLGIPKSRISIGFYGVKRQSYIASLIKKKFSVQIDSAALTSKVIQYWTTDSFVLYVLTCEIVMRMVQQDFNYTKEEAVECLTNTFDYGKYISDHDTLD